MRFGSKKLTELVELIELIEMHEWFRFVSVELTLIRGEESGRGGGAEGGVDHR